MQTLPSKSCINYRVYINKLLLFSSYYCNGLSKGHNGGTIALKKKKKGLSQELIGLELHSILVIIL